MPQVDTVPALVQNEIHPYYQENDVIPFIQDLGIVVQGGVKNMIGIKGGEFASGFEKLDDDVLFGEEIKA
ncbi:hypothetical protein NXH76_12485 [Blautia schinkii]|nr:hypothetical protein [Blautia schinkii]